MNTKNRFIKTSAIIIFNLFLFNYAFSQDLTFTKDIASIIYTNCTSCHRPGEVAPFPLVSYKDVASKAKMILNVIESHYMPPWKADPNYLHYANERILRNGEIDSLKHWVDLRMPKGKKSDLPPLPSDYTGYYNLGKPDYVFRMKKPFLIKGNNKQKFVWIKIPYDFHTKEEYLDLMTVELVPDNKKYVHHIQTSWFEFDKKYNNLLEKGNDFYLKEDSITNSDFIKLVPAMEFERPKLVHMGLWSPGVTPQIFEDNIGSKIPSKGIFIAGMHYEESPTDVYDNSHFNVYLKKKPVERVINNIDIGLDGDSPVEPPLVIPPDTIATFYSKLKINGDLSILYAMPHMHLIAKKFLAYAITPQKDTIKIIKINDWAYNWQEFYKFNPMLKIPRGSTIHIEGTYDNTSSNPNNPFNPPRTISSLNKQIMETKEEMLNLFLIVLPYKEGDEKRKLDLK